MGRILTVTAVVTLLGSSAFAQSTQTLIVNASGLLNPCRSVRLTVTKTINTETRTWIQVDVYECPTGGTAPTVLTIRRQQTIPDTDLQADNRGARLSTSLPEGTITLNFTPTRDEHNTYTATWTWDKAGTTRRDTQKDDTISANASGGVFGQSGNLSGYIFLSTAQMGR